MKIEEAKAFLKKRDRIEKISDLKFNFLRNNMWLSKKFYMLRAIESLVLGNQEEQEILFNSLDKCKDVYVISKDDGRYFVDTNFGFGNIEPIIDPKENQQECIDTAFGGNCFANCITQALKLKNYDGEVVIGLDREYRPGWLHGWIESNNEILDVRRNMKMSKNLYFSLYRAKELERVKIDTIKQDLICSKENKDKIKEYEDRLYLLARDEIVKE